eukprot:756826-Hanusia_phi.AAC.1
MPDCLPGVLSSCSYVPSDPGMNPRCRQVLTKVCCPRPANQHQCRHKTRVNFIRGISNMLSAICSLVLLKSSTSPPTTAAERRQGRRGASCCSPLTVSPSLANLSFSFSSFTASSSPRTCRQSSSAMRHQGFQRIGAELFRRGWAPK